MVLLNFNDKNKEKIELLNGFDSESNLIFFFFQKFILFFIPLKSS